ncbi:MAG: DUF4954 family protein [Planctomycetaceae bacterium]|nr:DUF4954 family protein [Planctomycetaceae bacterium]
MERQLTADEVTALVGNGCAAEDWGAVTVADGFAPGRVFRTRFAGSVRVGARCGLTDASLADVWLGDDCVIDRSRIRHTAEREPFGLGHPVHVLAEDGARQVPLYQGLSSQLAHLLCHLQSHPVAAKLLDIVEADILSLDASRSHIGDGCRVTDTVLLENVWLGQGTIVEGAVLLRNCYTPDAPASPARILEGVRFENGVALAGSLIDGGSRLHACLVGEGVVVDRTFSAKHSLFFANSEFHLGEAACAMAGPFANSHHKATLVLACQCSFNTFGSTANSSNHHFKLGARHGGVLRRGARCGSGSYIFWPADIGAFSTVVGKHLRHIETADFPFSLLLEKNGESVLVPGVYLFSAGMTRDGTKWPKRDRRAAIAEPLDAVNPAIFSPYTMQALETGSRLLRRSHTLDADLRHNGAVIPAERIAPALQVYETALVFYIGECLLRAVRRLKGNAALHPADFLQVIDRGMADAALAGGKWRDWGGMLLSGHDADHFHQDVLSGVLATPEAVRERFRQIHASYEARELAWAASRWRRDHGDGAGEDPVVAFLGRWRNAVRFRYDSLLRDVGKEFTREVMYGFGVEESAIAAFRRVRGDPGAEQLVLDAREERDTLLGLVDGIV